MAVVGAVETTGRGAVGETSPGRVPRLLWSLFKGQILRVNPLGCENGVNRVHIID